MTKLLYFTRTQERRRDGVFVSLKWRREGGLYSSGGENMNEMAFLMRVDKGSKRIMNLNLISIFGES